ncbi:MAG: 1-phosphofructokinase family hexose kinase [Gammaproteobacteria bacterium]|nr:1-phosphofructokinase family hexose kinase [Gammaproteobacteria bacterium]
MPANEHPISILALNPSVDISYEIDQLVSSKKIRSTHTQYYPGGNGINVARALNELKLPLSLYSIIGGESGNLLLRLLGDKLTDCHHYFSVEGETRLNAIIQQSNPPGQYEVDSTGPDIPEETVEQIIEAFLEVSHNNIAVLSGSIPPGVKETVYRDLTARLQQQGSKVIVDANGDELMNVMNASPYLLRLNRYVLESIVNRRLEQPEEVAEAAREIQKKGSNMVCVTLGQQGALLVDQKNSYYCVAPKVRIKSTVGCGDAMISGMISAISQGKSSAEILRFGVICGSTTASHPGTELFEFSEVMKEYDELEVISLNI